jgi:RimJ/RimL family protein N-acetyltransferase
MTPVSSLGPRVLKGRFVQLEPYMPAHREDLRVAANDAALWRYMPVDGSGDGFDAWRKLTEADMASGSRIIFAVRRLAGGALVGSTSYLNIVPEHARAEIGWTWYAQTAQGGVVNPEVKLLLFANAFETSGYNRIELKTDAGNARSRSAILKLGAKEEGVFRGHMWMPRGYWRDTVYYSVLREEWPGVKAGLERRLRAFSS